MRFALLALILGVLSACEAAVPTPTETEQSGLPNNLTPETAARNFAEVVRRVEPVAEKECRQRAPQLDCDFNIVIDRREKRPHAFQTRNSKGRPQIVFTIGLISDARNQDELAFILGHEAAHHIAGHIDRAIENAERGALLLGSIAQAAGQSPAQVKAAVRVGAAVGARTYSKNFELEADTLGTRISFEAGFNPLRGAQFFNRIPDPGDQFLGTHPPNAQRFARVRSEYQRIR